jgi:hypothetical protein
MKKLLPVVVALLIFSCKKDEPAPEPVEIAVNGNLENGSTSLDGWFTSGSNSVFNIEWTDTYASSGSKSIMISSDAGDSQQFAYWGEQICDNVRVGKKIVLKVKVKANLVGTGVSLALRADDSRTSTSGLEFVSTQQFKSITGTFDWQEFSVEMSAVPNGTQCLDIFLVYLQNTSGEVYFDDVSLIYQ